MKQKGKQNGRNGLNKLRINLSRLNVRRKQGSEPIEWQALMQFRNKEIIHVAVVYEKM